MAATEIANAYVALYTKMPGVEGDIKKSLGDADGAFEDAGDRGGAKFTGAAAKAIVAGAAVVAAAVVAVTTKAVMAFGELEQNVGGAEAVFGDYADTVKGKGVEAYKTLGLSQSDYLATANKMGALFQGSGIEQQRSLDLTTDAMQRAADMASVMGIEQSMAMESVAGAAKGNFTMMDNLGVAMNATNIEAYALSQGMEGWSFATATAAEKAEVAMAMFMDSTSQYAGNFEKEATETVTGSIGLMGAAWDSLMAGLGDADADMSQLTTNLVEAFGAVVQNVGPVIGEIFSSLPEALGALLPELGEMFAGFFDGLTGGSDLGGLIGQFIELWATLSPLGMAFEALAPLLPMIMDLFTQIQEAVTPIIEAILPILTSLFEALIPIIMMVVEAIVPLLEPIFALVAPLLEIVDMLLPPLLELFGMLIPIIGAIVQAIATFLLPVFTAVVDAISGVLAPAIQMIQDVLAGVNDFIVGVFTGDWERAWEGIVGIFSGIWNGLTGIVKGIINGIIGIVNGAIEGINGIASGVSDLTGGAISFTIPSIPQLAEGGIIAARPGGIIANIGEGRYDEAVVPLSPAVLSQIGGGGSNGPLVEVNAAPGMDAEEVGRIAANAVAWQMRGA